MIQNSVNIMKYWNKDVKLEYIMAQNAIKNMDSFVEMLIETNKIIT